MRLILAASLLAAPIGLAAQQVPADTSVERVTLAPGETSSFTLAPGIDHQLLKAASPGAKGAITIRYDVANGQSTITAESRIGHPLVFTVLADPDGNGGFEAAGEITVAGDGTPAVRSWPGTLGTINVGDFKGGPHGGEQHQPSGEPPAG